LPNGEPAKNRSFVIAREDGSRIRGRSDAQGRTGLQKSIQLERVRITILPSNT
jgi:type VI secretion system secreted protein VgrG